MQGMEGLPHDIYGLAPSASHWLGYGVWTLLIALVIGLGVWLWRRLRQAKQHHADPRDPWDLLEERVSKLTITSDFLRKQQEMVFYELSLSLRDAIERHTNLPAPTMTLRELKAALDTKLPFDQSQTQAVVRFLERADLVKFAAAEASFEEAEEARRQVLSWIRALRSAARPEVPSLPVGPSAGHRVDDRRVVEQRMAAGRSSS